MKLPENRQDRIKLVAVIVLGTALVLLGVVQGIVNPLTKARGNKLARLAECQTGVEKARGDIGQAARMQKLNIDNIKSIKDTSDRHVLAPVLGNYLLGASDIVERMARALDIAIDPVREVGISEIPGPRDGKTPNALKSYTVRVSFVASFHDAVRFLREVEISNPYLCVVGLTIHGQPEVNPERHKVVFDIQWPIWADSGTPEDLQRQLQEVMNL